MSTTPPARPHGFWKQEAATLRRIAPTMTLDQLVKHYDTTRRRMLQELNKLKLGYADKQPRAVLTAAQVAQLPQLATTHTPRQISEMFDVDIDRVHAYLCRLKIKAVSGRIPTIWEHRRAELQAMAPSMTLKALQAHYRQLGHEHTINGIRQALRVMDIRYQHDRSKPPRFDSPDQLREMARRMTCPQMALQLGYTHKYMCKLLKTLGITPQPARSKPVPKVRNPKHPNQGQKLAKRTVCTTAAIPSRASIASKVPAQIIWPEHVQIQHIPLATPPAHAPICASTARGTYTPSKDWYRSPRAH